MNFNELKSKILASRIVARVAVAHAEGEEVFDAFKLVEQFCLPIFVGNKNTILQGTKQANLTKFEIVASEDKNESAHIAVNLVRQGKANLLMKGNLTTSTIIKAALDKNSGIRSGNLISHIILFETSDNKFLAVTDPGINIQPDLPAKVAIINNAIELFHKLGVTKPRVAVLSAIEVVNPKMPSSVDAALLAHMSAEGKFKDAIINGPISLDLAISAKARKIKNFENTANANADILVVPEIVSGNLLSKALIYMAGYKSGGIALGASAPIILLSRSDSAETKHNSIILGITACFAF